MTLEDYQPGTRTRFGHYVVTREEVIDFASKYDPQPFHLDDEAAAANPIFGRLSASGWHTAAMTMRMIVDEGKKHPDGHSMGSPGLDKLRWIKPVYPGDVLRVEAEVLESRRLKSRPDTGVVRNRTEVFNQNDEMVMLMESAIMVRLSD